ncbi:DUF2937 family protein [Pseudomonas sp. GD03842]|uniref:DUF2937 family protein n=1 Tax=unclassified Pseudomonas TaxID=196821 RepID=UPI000D35501C|nr:MULTISPECIES: DUF2937 family protein [unclassified Pseudomonas]MDH0747656.1 DUF2937 family protein [Pseudomonas sp. GD03842]RAU49310.1 DUF2937 family protein [Pseudomonas sp. RIT 409]RAU55949.1 DUF2937 family protein [Pseudomonas sp. RIT 412]
MLRSYVRLVLFTAGLLIGVQIPGFISDYSKRVEAHLMEAQQTLRGYNETAQRFFNGDVQALIQHYRNSEDPVFRTDANNISNLLSRNQLLDREWMALQGPWYLRAWHVLTAADPDIRAETWNGYTWQVLLSPEVIGWGLACALLFSLVIESFVVFIDWLFVGRVYKRRVRREWE